MQLSSPEVTYVDHMGDDLRVVDIARVSFAKKSSLDEDGNLRKEDVRLINFLARGYSSAERKYYEDLCQAFIDGDIDELPEAATHFTPFCGAIIQVHVKAPIFVARQLYKHKIGLVENEVSRRYVDFPPEFLKCEEWRARAANKKQGSSDELVMNIVLDNGDGATVKVPMTQAYLDLVDHSLRVYESAIKSGVCPEQARMCLLQSMMTEWYWTGSLMSFARVAKLRLDPHAQKETRDVALQLSNIAQSLFPVSWSALLGRHLPQLQKETP